MDDHGERAADRSWVVVAGPFIRADRLRAFLLAVGQLAGVTELVDERFQLGDVSLRLRYTGPPPLADALAALPEFAAHIAPEGSGVLRVTLSDSPRRGSCGDTGDGSQARAAGA